MKTLQTIQKTFRVFQILAKIAFVFSIVGASICALGAACAMTFIGFSTSIRPEEGYQKCPEFWDREYVQKYARLWQSMQPETAVEAAILENGVGLFAICDEKEGSFEYWIAGLYKGGEVPEGLKLYTFPESDWAMFSAKGPLPGSLQARRAKRARSS